MLLISTKVGPFKSIDTPQTVVIDNEVTVLVGMNEAGKTVFLKALEKSNDALGLAKFDPLYDYPIKDYLKYQKKHEISPDSVTVLTYRLTDDEVNELNDDIHTSLPPKFTFSVTHLYDNSIQICIDIDEKPVLETLIAESSLSTDAKTALKKAQSLRSIPQLFEDISLTEEDNKFLDRINVRVKSTESDSVVQWEVSEWLKSRIPKFLYFSDYNILPSKINIPDLASRVEQAKNDPKQLQPQHHAILALLRMADISIKDITNPSEGYDQYKVRIDAVSISLTDQIMEFWKQNDDIEVEVDIKPDSNDEVPYNKGSNLYLRIKSRRHRFGTPFDQRSRGFTWFFSFLVWFDSVHQLINSEKDIILLLDEPGLALHALAQADFLSYIDDLAKKHQVLYTTHSPFMVHSDRLYQVRMIEDKEKVGTVISDNLTGSNPRTIFPLQAALGWTIAQNLFISERNLLVEGASDLIYLKSASSLLEAQGRTGLREDVTIVPVGGLDNVVTFIALLGSNNLKLAVLHDYRGKPEQKLQEIAKEKIINTKALLNASQFRNLESLGKDGKASDTEDLFEPTLYLEYFNRTFSGHLNNIVINYSELPARDRIINRIESHLVEKDIKIRPSGGFNHYAVASFFASNPPAFLDDNTLNRFEALFKAINSLFE